ncbi:MAG: tRNA (adenosine(37)-N6)-threonylcarbamoyltransferase complex ATPase subunit type 1 TsaE, partial [Hyphomicrobiales bacterium]|nr:tRNA (adenosine(37)-N6)-threonylcarbamoyltransferase complex ATPase subunit type 1 TsaE [Hyphomicrobiales bacterium]
MSADWKIIEADLTVLDRISSLVAHVVKPGDLVALSGELGAGKTTFARLLITHLSGATNEEIPSPTFALAQRYELGRFPVTHIDCYRLDAPSEIEEIGLEDAVDEGVVLIEWPERVAGYLPPDRIDIHLEDAGSETTRNLLVTGHGAFAPRLDRLEAMAEFIEREGWGAAAVSYLQGDASTRAYAQLSTDGQNAILMDAPKIPDGPPVRNGKAYSTIAHLAEDVSAFVAVANALREAGFSAPEIMAHDLAHGFLILEDLGKRVFAAEIAAGGDEEILYRAAADALVALRKVPAVEKLALPGGAHHRLPPYDVAALEIEVELLLDWFWPLVHGQAAPDNARAGFLEHWRPLFAQLGAEPEGWVLRDYHSPNLLWLPERTGLARVGIIDFQDAVRGPAAYDLVSLLQDARRTVSPALEETLFRHYCASVEGSEASFDPDSFKATYAMMGAQRNTKILGIFARLATRDGKRDYLSH